MKPETDIHPIYTRVRLVGHQMPDLSVLNKWSVDRYGQLVAITIRVAASIKAGEIQPRSLGQLEMGFDMFVALNPLVGRGGALIESELCRVLWFTSIAAKARINSGVFELLVDPIAMPVDDATLDEFLGSDPLLASIVY